MSLSRSTTRPRLHKYCILLLKASLVAESMFRLGVSQKLLPPLTVLIPPADVGEDVDMCIQRLLQAANYDGHRARCASRRIHLTDFV
jgi:ATP-dependent protease Clp ATPase subunit